jgi:hypothetical protein
MSGQTSAHATAHRLGPRAQAAAHLLPYGVGVPVRKVPAVLQMLTGLQVTQSALTQAALRAGNEAGPVAYRNAELRAEIKAQSVVNTDDTGWRLGGRRAQLMSFESEPVRVYQIRPQHRNDEVREVIGDDYQGILGTDRGKSYEARELLSVKQQKCLAHIQRLLSEALAGKRGMARFFGEVLQSQLTEAMDLHRQVHDPEKRLPDDDRRVRALEAEVSHHLRPPQLRDSDNQRLLNELGRHHERGNLLRFVHEPEVAPTNNAAERALRPAVIARKVSHCSKNGRGAQAFSALTSVIRTMIKSGATHVLESLTRLLDPSPPPETAS